MWQVILNNIDYSLFGYGFGGVFWGDGNPAEYVVGRFYYKLGHAHNGFIDAFIDMGIIGLIAYPLILLLPFIHAVKKYNHGKKDYALTILVLSFLTIVFVLGVQQLASSLALSFSCTIF